MDHLSVSVITARGGESKAVLVRREELGAMEIDTDLGDEELFSGVDGLGVNNGATNHPNVFTRVDSSELVEANESVKADPQRLRVGGEHEVVPSVERRANSL